MSVSIRAGALLAIRRAVTGERATTGEGVDKFPGGTPVAGDPGHRTGKIRRLCVATEPESGAWGRG